MNSNRNLKYIGLMVMCLCSIGMFVGYKKNNTLRQAERFINTQVNCETYRKVGGDQFLLEEIFLEYFEKDAYEKYLNDVFGYMYPQLFYVTNADQIKMQKIKCKETKKLRGGLNKYQFEIKYTIIPVQEEGKKISNISMQDVLEITVNNENKLTEVIVLNTSDIIKKLFLDIKVQ